MHFASSDFEESKTTSYEDYACSYYLLFCFVVAPFFTQVMIITTVAAEQ